MKINIGCGYNYLPGYLNIDASGASAADRRMEAHALDLPDRSAEEIKALQLVEHLGFFKTKYFLAECWRVLAAGGTLSLETPDIEKTFEVFLNGGHKIKEAALGWVYGSETPGMNHLYCFPAGLLEELLSEAGFEVTARAAFDFQPGRPALRFAAAKRAGEKAALNAALRRRLAQKGLAGFSDELEAAGMDLVVRRLLGCGGDKARALELALYSASAVLEFFSLEEENDHHPSAEAAACSKLAAAGVQALLLSELEKNCAGGEVTQEAFAAALEHGRGLLAAALRGETPAPAGPGPAPLVFTFDTARAVLAKKRALLR
ncbi:MAG: SAM-dependent methyltransferase [Elusimicrobia bacterium]|nr:SAM-dependent methyltransferase [Elusimicrobiota bacterium]